jgi:hypothetical protein
MSPSDYVIAYLNVPVSFDSGGIATLSIKNYLQEGLGTQSQRAHVAQTALFSAIARDQKISGTLPAEFDIDGTTVVRNSLRRVFMGKGAPDEIQTALWLASKYNLVDNSTCWSYCDKNLGIDCGGFVANFWGIGKPVSGANEPQGWSGFKPRTLWNLNRGLRRDTPDSIQIGDAAVFFRKVQSNNPDMAGSEAFHIAIVSNISPGNSSDQWNIWVAESSGEVRNNGANGVHERQLGDGTLTLRQAVGLAYYENPNKIRCYFVGPNGTPTPYEAETYALA